MIVSNHGSNCILETYKAYILTLWSQKLAEIFIKKNNFVTLSSMYIAIVVCETFILALKVTTVVANHRLFRQLDFVNLSYYTNKFLLL